MAINPPMMSLKRNQHTMKLINIFIYTMMDMNPNSDMMTLIMMTDIDMDMMILILNLLLIGELLLFFVHSFPFYQFSIQSAYSDVLRDSTNCF